MSETIVHSTTTDSTISVEEAFERCRNAIEKNLRKGDSEYKAVFSATQWSRKKVAPLVHAHDQERFLNMLKAERDKVRPQPTETLIREACSQPRTPDEQCEFIEGYYGILQQIRDSLFPEEVQRALADIALSYLPPDDEEKPNAPVPATPPETEEEEQLPSSVRAKTPSVRPQSKQPQPQATKKNPLQFVDQRIAELKRELKAAQAAIRDKREPERSVEEIAQELSLAEQKRNVAVAKQRGKQSHAA